VNKAGKKVGGGNSASLCASACAGYVSRPARFLAHILILGERHLRRTIATYVRYFNHARPHQGINGQIPIPASAPPPIILPLSQLRRIPILGGLHHAYQWAT